MRSYEEIAESLLRRRDEYIDNQRVRRNIMKKRIIALSAFCLAVLIGIGVWQADLFKTKPIETPIESAPVEQEAETDKPVESAPAESEQPSTSHTTEQPAPPAIGGDGAWWTLHEYTDQYDGNIIHSVHPDIKKFVDEEIYDDWINQFWFVNKETYTRTDVFSIIKFLDEVGGITKEQLMTIDHYTDNLTQEEIDLIFSDDHAVRDQALVSPYAIYANGRIYNAAWLDIHNAEDYIAAGMTKAQLLEKVPAWDELNYGDANAFVNLDRIVEEINKMP